MLSLNVATENEMMYIVVVPSPAVTAIRVLPFTPAVVSATCWYSSPCVHVISGNVLVPTGNAYEYDKRFGSKSSNATPPTAMPFSDELLDFSVENTSLYTVWSPLAAVTVTRTVPSTTPAPSSLTATV